MKCLFSPNLSLYQPSHRPWFDDHNICRWLQITELLNIPLSSTSSSCSSASALSNTLGLSSSHNPTNQVLHPYETGKIVILFKSISEMAPMFFLIDAICGGILRAAANRNTVALGYKVMKRTNILCRYKQVSLWPRRITKCLKVRN